MEEAVILHISWLTEIGKRNPFHQISVKVDLEKPFKMSKCSLFPSQFVKLRYRIDKIETKCNIFEVMDDNKIKITQKENKYETITDESPIFKVSRFTKVHQVYTLSPLFGFEDIEECVTKYINSKMNMTICLSGRNGAGKYSFIKQLELRNPNKHFIYMNEERFCDKKDDYLIKLEKAIEKYAKMKTVIFCCIDADFDSYTFGDSMFLSSILSNAMKNSEMSLKVLVTCRDMKLLDPNIKGLVTKIFSVTCLSDDDQAQYVKFLLSRICGRERSEDGLNLFAKSLRGFSPADINVFLIRLAQDCPELSVQELLDALRTKKCVPRHITERLSDFERLRWSDIGGYEDVKEKLRDSIQIPLSQGRDIDTGVLLYGPPGCSKTMLVRALATECNLNMVTVTPSSIMSCYVGETEAKLRKIWTQAFEMAPSILFIDEIDMLIPRRGVMKDSTVSDRLLSELLDMTDGATNRKEDRKVIFIAATNRLDNVDEALTRPGRMSIRIEIGLPDILSIEAILKLSLSDKQLKVSKEVLENIPQIAKILVGKSGAEIVHIGKEIRRCWRRQGKVGEVPPLTMDALTDFMNQLGLHD